MIHDMSLFNRNQFLEDFYAQIMSIVVPRNHDFNTAFINFHNAFYEMIDKYAPLRPVTRREQFSKREPWITKRLSN